MAENTPHIEPTLTETGSLAPAYFDQLYATKADPWEFASSAYEAQKYAATLDALPRPQYENALEIGCSIGVFTAQLAPRCNHLLAVDVSAAALTQARRRCAGFFHVKFENRDIAAEFPKGTFDLILVSEVAYYFALPVLLSLRAKLAAALNPGGHLLLVHFTGLTNYPLSANTVHETFLQWEGTFWRRIFSRVAAEYRLDLLEKIPCDPESSTS